MSALAAGLLGAPTSDDDSAASDHQPKQLAPVFAASAFGDPQVNLQTLFQRWHLR